MSNAAPASPRPKSEQFAVVTGASSGIGLELARCFAADGYGLVLAAEDRVALDQVAAEMRAAGSPRAETVAVDLASADGPDVLFRAVQDWGLSPEFLVNNAGVGVFGDFTRDTDLEAELAMIRLNVLAVVRLTKLFAPGMVRRGSGKVLVTSSMAALAPSPNLTVYSATKAFDYAFAEGLAGELKGTGVTVTALLPAGTDTGFFARAGMEDTNIGRSDKADPADIAAAGYGAMMKGADHVVAPFAAKVKAALTSVLPQAAVVDRARTE